MEGLQIRAACSGGLEHVFGGPLKDRIWRCNMLPFQSCLLSELSVLHLIMPSHISKAISMCPVFTWWAIMFPSLFICPLDYLDIKNNIMQATFRFPLPIDNTTAYSQGYVNNYYIIWEQASFLLEFWAFFWINIVMTRIQFRWFRFSSVFSVCSWGVLCDFCWK
jgi:hypothetical protein